MVDERHGERGHPSRRILETYAFASDEGQGVTAQVRRHFERCPICMDEIDWLRDARKAFVSERPPVVFAAGISEKMAGSNWLERLLRGTTLKLVVPLTASLVLAAGIILYSLGPYGSMVSRDDASPANRITLKGTDALQFSLFVSRNGASALPHTVDTALHENDVLRFGIRSAKGGAVTIANIDDTGRVSIYYASHDSGAAPIEAGVFRIIDESIVLDEFMGNELIVAVVSKNPVSQTKMTQALRAAFKKAGGRLDLMSRLDIEGDIALYPIEKTTP